MKSDSGICNTDRVSHDFISFQFLDVGFPSLCRNLLNGYISSRKSELFCCQFIFISTPTQKEFLSKSESSYCTEQGSHLDRICLRRSCMTFVYAFTSTTYDTTWRGEPSRKP